METKLVRIQVDGVNLEGILAVPTQAKSIVIFVHGSGSSRLSPRNNFVAEVLQDAGFATLLFDLLTTREDASYKNRFNIPLLTERLKKVTDWVLKQPDMMNFKIGYFGASTGSASAIIAAADLGKKISAVVSRGGRPDLAGEALARLLVPILLVVGGNDDVVIDLNKKAGSLIIGEKMLQIIPGATHLFEESGTLEEVARLAAEWFQKHLTQVT